MIISLLVGLAGTENSEAVVETAVNLAASHRVPITAITAVDVRTLRNVGPVPPGGGQAAKDLREHRLDLTREVVDEAVAQFKNRCEALGLAYRIKQEESDSPFDFLASRSRYHDITILGLRGIFDYDIRMPEEPDASVTLARLISSGVRPILAVPREYRPVKRVFVAYSGSMESAATLRRFLQLRPYDDIELCIATFEMREERSRRLLTHASRYCQGHDIVPETVHFRENAHDHLLVKANEWNADLIVLGNSAKNLLLRRVFGETALKAIHDSELPLFLSQ